MLDQMNHLRELAVELAKAKDFTATLDIVLHKICTATGWACGDVWAPAPNGRHLVCLRAWHAPSEEVELDNTFVDTYRYGKPGKYALISVADTGVGMDEKTINKDI